MKMPWTRRREEREATIAQAEKDFEPSPQLGEIFHVSGPNSGIDVQSEGEIHIKGDPLILEGPCKRIDKLKREIIVMEVLLVFQAGVVFWILVR